MQIDKDDLRTKCARDLKCLGAVAHGPNQMSCAPEETRQKCAIPCAAVCYQDPGANERGSDLVQAFAIGRFIHRWYLVLRSARTVSARISRPPPHHKQI